MFDMFYIHMPNNMQHQMAYHGLGTDQVTDVSGPVTDFWWVKKCSNLHKALFCFFFLPMVAANPVYTVQGWEKPVTGGSWGGGMSHMLDLPFEVCLCDQRVKSELFLKLGHVS